MIKIKVPGSSANLGPGFDVFGLALEAVHSTIASEVTTASNALLELQVVFSSQQSPSAPLNCEITCAGLGAESLSRAPDVNLITRVALYVLRCHGQHAFPSHTKLHIINGIPLSRGLGSSGAAVVAGVVLGNEAGGFGLSKDRMLDYCLMVERHPDNVAAALYGGFVGSFLRTLDPTDTARKEIPLSEVLPEPAGGEDTGLRVQEPPVGIGSYHRFRWTPEIKALVIIPDFKVDTAKARGVLPLQYSREDAIFNNQRSSLLPVLLSESPPDAAKISEAMRDRMHQPYRQLLVPGLAEVLDSLRPSSHPGLLGICLSGAGPTILALATHNFEAIAQAVIIILKKGQEVQCHWQVLQPALGGAMVQRVDQPCQQAQV